MRLSPKALIKTRLSVDSMATAITFSRQNDADSRVRTI